MLGLKSREPGVSAGLPVVAGLSDQAKAFQRAGKAMSTQRAYASDVTQFSAWCDQFGFQALPATSLAVLEFLSHEATRGAKASTIARRLAAIRYAHKLAGLADPTDDEGLREGIRPLPTAIEHCRVDGRRSLLSRGYRRSRRFLFRLSDALCASCGRKAGKDNRDQKKLERA